LIRRRLRGGPFSFFTEFFDYLILRFTDIQILKIKLTIIHDLAYDIYDSKRIYRWHDFATRVEGHRRCPFDIA